MPGSIGDSNFEMAERIATSRTRAAANGTPLMFTKRAKSDNTIPSTTIGTAIWTLPTPAARIAVNSLSPCNFERPMIVPTKTALGQVNAMTFGMRPIISCHMRPLGIFTLKNNSEYRLACWRKRMTVSRTHENRKYGTTAPNRYREMSQLTLFIRTAGTNAEFGHLPAGLCQPCRSPLHARSFV